VNTAVFHDREAWLALLEDLFDPPTVERLERTGLERARAEAVLDFFAGGSDKAEFFCRVLEGAAASLVAGGHLSRGAVEQMRARFEDPERIDCGWPRIGATGWRPA
jgi:hypothetical protein